MVGVCHGDHEMLEFKIFGLMRKNNKRVAILDFMRANLKLFRELCGRVLWESAFEGLGARKCWSMSKNYL